MYLSDKAKAISAEDLIRRYNLEGLKSYRKDLNSLGQIIKRQDTIVKDYIKNITPYKNQAKNTITAWFYDGLIDTTEASENDVLYDKETGFIYQLLNGSWAKLEDSELQKSLSYANSNADTADNKRVLYFTEPTTPYKTGDIWLNDNEIMRCRCTRDSGEFKDVDWIIQSEYSEECVLNETRAILNQFQVDVKTNYVTSVKLESTKDSILGSVETKVTQVKGELESEISSYSSQLSMLSNRIDLKLSASSFTKDAVISLINNMNGSSTAKINATNIDLSGTNINLTSNNINITSDNLGIDKFGNISINETTSTVTWESTSFKMQNSTSNGKLTMSTYYFRIENRFGDYTQIDPGAVHFSDGRQYTPFSFYTKYGNNKIYSAASTDTPYLRIEKGTIESTILQSNGIWSPAYNNNSLESKKKNVEFDNGCLEQILNTDIVNFNWNFEDDGDKKHIGLIIPDLGGNYKYAEKALTHDGDAVDLYSMVAMAWKAIQELNRKIEEK